MIGGDIEYLLGDFNEFGGVYTKAQRANCTAKKIFILNTGNHWISIDQRGSPPIFFDSLSKGAEHYDLQDILKPLVLSNTMRIQSNTSDACGCFAIFFVVHRLKGFSMKKILSFFKEEDYKYNEALVLKWLPSMSFV